MVVVLNIVIKYSGLKLLVEVIGVYPSISNAILTVVTVVVSYLLQKTSLSRTYRRIVSYSRIGPLFDRLRIRLFFGDCVKKDTILSEIDVNRYVISSTSYT